MQLCFLVFLLILGKAVDGQLVDQTKTCITARQCNPNYSSVGKQCINGFCTRFPIAECFKDSECSYRGRMCVNGRCKDMSSLRCAQPADCPAGRECHNYYCTVY